MGVEYELFNPKTNERFELGKGMWCQVFNGSKSFTLTEKDLYDLYKNILGNAAVSFNTSIRLQYFYDLAVDIIKWGRGDPIEFWEDQNFYDAKNLDNISLEDFDAKYPFTGSRYKEDVDNSKTMKLVAFWTTSNGFTISNDYVQPFEYASEEAFAVDFERATLCAIKNKQDNFCFAGVMWRTSDFMVWGLAKEGDALPKIDIPDILPLEEWFKKYNR